MMKGENQTTASELPFHIIHDIMLNLPLKSLLRFKLVSTEWLKEITNQDFARAQLLNQKKNWSVFIIDYPHITDGHIAKVFYVDKKSALEAAKSREGLRPLNFRWPIDLSPDLVSSLKYCDGIFYATFNCFSSIILWNPFTGWDKTVPYYRSERLLHLGLGYNPIDNDYKYVMMQDCHIEIFSLKSCTWKRICTVSPDIYNHARHRNAFHLNGTLYWFDGRDFGNGIFYINCVDLIEEKFKIIPIPKPTSKFLVSSPSMLTSYRGMLCMIWKLGKSEKYKDLCGHEIWVMKEGNNWVTKFDIPVYLGHPICCTHEGALFLSEPIYMYDSEKGSITSFKVHGLGFPLFYIGYVASLVTPLVAEKPPVMHTYSRKRKRNSSMGMDVLRFGKN